jgi:hypothetical protein
MRIIRRKALPCTCGRTPEDPSRNCPRHDLTIDARTWAIDLELVK